MTPIENAARVLKQAWSIRLALLSAVFSALEFALPFLTDAIPPKTMAILAIFTAVGSAAARLVAQPKLHE
jgi:hypothetical protein